MAEPAVEKTKKAEEPKDKATGKETEKREVSSKGASSNATGKTKVATNNKKVAVDSSKGLDILTYIGGAILLGAAVAITLDKVPRNILVTVQSAFSYFYILALIGIVGALPEKFAIFLVGLIMPLFMMVATFLIRYKPNRFPIEDWWDQYSVMIIFSMLSLIYLYIKFDNLKKSGVGAPVNTTGSVFGVDGKLKTRVDPTLAARYREEQSKKSSSEATFDKALGLKEDEEKKEKEGKIGVPGVAKPASSEPDKKESVSVETNEERMEREVREMRENFNKKSMRLTTTLMRIKNLAKSLDRDQIFSNTVEIITKGLDAKRVQLLLNDEENGKLHVVKAFGMKPTEYKNYEVPYEEVSMITHLLSLKTNEVTGNTGAFGVKECEMDPQMKGLIGKGVLKTILAVPIYAEGKLFAIINVEEMNNPDYTRDDQNLLTTCADVAGLVMKNAKLYSATMADLVSAQKLSEDQLKKNEQLRGSLSRIVSPSVAEMIMSDPSALKLGGKKCEVTMFFSDIRGFTKMSENMDPTDIVDQLNVYFTRMTDILMELDGTLDKYVGDELMALFGAPVAKADDPIRAVLCGVRMLEALFELHKIWEKENKPIIKIGVGINTGIVTAGYMGSEKALSYTVIGDNVNLAARIMAQAKGMEMFITRSTYERVKDYFEIEQRESIMVKGKSMPIEIFCVKKVKDGVDMTQVIGKDVGHIASDLGGDKPNQASSQPVPFTRPTTLPPGMKEEDMKQNVKIEEVKMIDCSNCGQSNPPQEKFCTKCGMPIF